MSSPRHDHLVRQRYGGTEFEARMKLFPDGYYNLGYWAEGVSDPAVAARALAERAFDELDASKGETVLDVGCGIGRGTIDLCRRAACRAVVGVDITPENVAFANRRQDVAELPVSFHVMSASAMAFADGTFDKIVAVDCAVHFHTRAEFFEEAARVLVPGGRMVLVDTCINRRAQRGLFRWLAKPLLTGWCVPSENVYGLDEYRDKLLSAGFEVLEGRSILPYTLTRTCEYVLSFRQLRRAIREEGLGKALAEFVVFFFMRRAVKWGLLDYVLFVCKRAPAVSPP